MRHDTRLQRAILETLESRQLLSTYYVSTEGDDANDGSAAHPWRTLQQAADSVTAGDVVTVAVGKYDGFTLGLNRPVTGTAKAPIVFRGTNGSFSWRPSTIIGDANGDTPDGIYIASGTDYVTIEGFKIDGQKSLIPRAAVRIVGADHVTLRNLTLRGAGEYGVSALRADYMTIADSRTEATREHDAWNVGISVIGGDYAVIRSNEILRSERHAIELRADNPDGSAGLVYNASVRNNEFGLAFGGASVHFAGVRQSTLKNNIVENTNHGGLVLRDVPGVGGSKNNLIISNTFFQQSTRSWPVNLKFRSTGNTLINNIMVGTGNTPGSLAVSADSTAGLVTDYNIYDGRLSLDGGQTIITLEQWRAADASRDQHSLVATPNQLFQNGYSPSHPFARSPAVDAANPDYAPPADYRGMSRTGNGPDIGAAELRDVTQSHRIEQGEMDGVTLHEISSGSYFRLTPAFCDDFDAADHTNPDSSITLGSSWEILPWAEGSVPVADITTGNSSVTIQDAIVRSTVSVSGSAVDAYAYFDYGLHVDVGAGDVAQVFGVGTSFGTTSGNYWAVLFTRGDQSTIYAQVNVNGTIREVDTGVSPSETMYGHGMRIEPTALGFDFFVHSFLNDPSLPVASINDAGVFPGGTDVRVLFGAHPDTPLYVDHVEAGGYQSGGTLVTEVFDERLSGGWGSLRAAFSFLQSPEGTGFSFETRTGQTASPDGSWSDWQALGTDGAIASPDGRYIQIRVTFLTPTTTRTPSLRDFYIELRTPDWNG